MLTPTCTVLPSAHDPSCITVPSSVTVYVGAPVALSEIVHATTCPGVPYSKVTSPVVVIIGGKFVNPAANRLRWGNSRVT